jgi:hypothetical protein
MLCQYEYHLTPRQAQELIWSRFISTHNAPAHNIPCDLHQEHLNRVVKDSIRGLHANKTPKAISRAGKLLGTLSPLLENFDHVNEVSQLSGAHKTPSFLKDRDMIVQHLQKCRIFSYHKGRMHKSFPQPRDVLHNHDYKKIVDWMTDKVR